MSTPKDSLMGWMVEVRYEGNNREALVLGEDPETLHLLFWSRRRERWDVTRKSGTPVPRKDLIKVLHRRVKLISSKGNVNTEEVT